MAEPRRKGDLEPSPLARDLLFPRISLAGGFRLVVVPPHTRVRAKVLLFEPISPVSSNTSAQAIVTTLGLGSTACFPSGFYRAPGRLAFLRRTHGSLTDPLQIRARGPLQCSDVDPSQTSQPPFPSLPMRSSRGRVGRRPVVAFPVLVRRSHLVWLPDPPCSVSWRPRRLRFPPRRRFPSSYSALAADRVFSRPLRHAADGGTGFSACNVFLFFHLDTRDFWPFRVLNIRPDSFALPTTLLTLCALRRKTVVVSLISGFAKKVHFQGGKGRFQF